jgi:dopamine receptor D1
MINTSGHQIDDVLYNANDEVYHPIIQNNFLMVIKFICCLIGIPLNVSIAVTIIRRRNLRNQPRNIFLLGIILSYVSFFVPAIIELLYWGPYPIDSVCQSYVAVMLWLYRTASSCPTCCWPWPTDTWPSITRYSTERK